MPLLSKERADRELKTEAKKREKEKVGLNLEAIRSALSLSLSFSFMRSHLFRNALMVS